MFVVSRFTINHGNKSATDDHNFASLEEAREFYNSIDLRNMWEVEKDCQPSHKLQLMEHVVFAKELYEFDEIEDEYGDTLEYDEFGIEDYRKDELEEDEG